MTTLTLNEVLNYWLESRIGVATRVKPKGYENYSASDNQENELRARCASFVDEWIPTESHADILFNYAQHSFTPIVPSPLNAMLGSMSLRLNRVPIYRCPEPDRPMRPRIQTHDIPSLLIILAKAKQPTSSWTLKKLFELKSYSGNVWKDDRGKWVISELGIEAIKADVSIGARKVCALC